MPLETANPEQDPQNFFFNVKISKVDKEKREVTGIATAEILDKQGECLAYEGCKEALKGWAGNVREMHQPKAVGRGLQIECDDASKTITVRSRVSKGAPDTWEKVLDGTLGYYSVSGERLTTTVKKASDVPEHIFTPLAPKRDSIRWTDKWRMTELSLVDSGANPMSAISLVKMDGDQIQESDVLAGDAEPAPAIEVIEKKVLSTKARNALPKSAFGYVDKDGKGHYPVKNKDGKCDAAHTRDALSRAAAAKKKGGTSADIAAKAMPKIRACAKKLKIGSFAEKADLFVILHDISKLEYEDSPCLEAPKGEFLKTDAVLEFAKDYVGQYAQSFGYNPVDFKTGYERYCQSAYAQQQWDMTELLQQVIMAIMSDPDLDLDAKESLVAESTDQFVSIFFEEAAEAEQDEEETEKLDKGESIVPTEPVPAVAAPAAVPAVAAPAAAAAAVEAPAAPDFTKMFSDLGADMKKSIGEAVAPVMTKVDELAKRVEKVEAQPAAKTDGKPVYRMIEKNGDSTNVGQAEDGRMVAVDDNGHEYTLAQCDADLADIKKQISALPLGDNQRAPLEIKFMKVNRIRKGLTGEGVWR